MFSMIRRRFTYANVVLTLALVFTMTGGAYAAKRYLITSTKQLSPSVIKALTGKAGPAGKEGSAGKVGANGGAGPQGPQGLPGPEGKQGKEGKEGEEGEEGREGKQGKEGNEGKEGKQGVKGEPWTPNSELPSGATETGAWASQPAEGKEVIVSISFPVALSSQLEESQVHFAPNPACPGTVEKPTAEAGDLCVYPGFAFKVELKSIDKPYGLNEGGAGTAGATLTIAGMTPPQLVNGTWAVTAK